VGDLWTPGFLKWPTCRTFRFGLWLQNATTFFTISVCHFTLKSLGVIYAKFQNYLKNCQTLKWLPLAPVPYLTLYGNHFIINTRLNEIWGKFLVGKHFLMHFILRMVRTWKCSVNVALHVCFKICQQEHRHVLYIHFGTVHSAEYMIKK
jgi:hypothetical protein